MWPARELGPSTGWPRPCPDAIHPDTMHASGTRERGRNPRTVLSAPDPKSTKAKPARSSGGALAGGPWPPPAQGPQRALCLYKRFLATGEARVVASLTIKLPYCCTCKTGSLRAGGRLRAASGVVQALGCHSPHFLWDGFFKNSGQQTLCSGSSSGSPTSILLSTHSSSICCPRGKEQRSFFTILTSYLSLPPRPPCNSGWDWSTVVLA